MTRTPFVSNPCPATAIVFVFQNLFYGQLPNAASILYYDLLSIEDYLVNEKDNVNLRYTDDWQDIVACCICLTHQQIEYIYKIYDKTYNYNYYYRKMEKNNGPVLKKDNPYD